MKTWLVMTMLPYLAQLLTPMIVDVVKKVTDSLGKKLSKRTVLVLAAAVGEAVNQLSEILAGVNGLPPGVSALIAVGAREFFNQLVVQGGKAPVAAMLILLSLGLGACGSGDGDDVTVYQYAGENQGNQDNDTDAGKCNGDQGCSSSGQ